MASTTKLTPYQQLLNDYPDLAAVLEGLIGRLKSNVSDGAIYVITDDWHARMDSLVAGLEAIKPVLTGAAYAAARAGITDAIKSLIASAHVEVSVYEEKVKSLSAHFNSTIDRIRADIDSRTDCSVEGPLNDELIQTLRQLRETRSDLQVLKSNYITLVEKSK